MVWVVSQHKNTRIMLNREKYILNTKRNSVERPNAFNLIVFTLYSFRYFVCHIGFLIQNSIFTLLLFHTSVYILNVHGVSETNSLRIRYSVLPFYTTCANRYTCQSINNAYLTTLSLMLLYQLGLRIIWQIRVYCYLTN